MPALRSHLHKGNAGSTVELHPRQRVHHLHISVLFLVCHEACSRVHLSDLALLQ